MSYLTTPETATVPVFAAEFISRIVTSRHYTSREAFIQALCTRDGLHDLTLSDMVKVWNVMKTIPYVKERRHSLPSPLHKKKAIMIQVIRQYFYTYPDCTEEDKRMEEALRTALIDINTTNDAARVTSSDPTSSPAKGTLATKNPHSNSATTGIQTPVRANMIQKADAMTGHHHISSNRIENSTIGRQIPRWMASPAQDGIPYNQTGSQTHVQSDAMPNDPNRGEQVQYGQVLARRTTDYPFGFKARRAVEVQNQTHGTKRYHIDSFETASKRMKPVKEESIDNDSNPRNESERALLGSMQTMGFNCRREVLASVRRLQDQSNHFPSADEIMIDIVTQREEAEEARKMDEARLASEQSRKEEARRRRMAIEQQNEEILRSQSISRWRNDPKLFANSWLLSSHIYSHLSKICEKSMDVKAELLKFLKLEKKARKWYHSTLPSKYFSIEVANRLASLSETAMKVHLVQETNTVESAMFQLSGKSYKSNIWEINAPFLHQFRRTKGWSS